MKDYTKDVYNEDCIEGSEKIEEGSVNIMIADPPFGINESEFERYYKRSSEHVLDGYQEAPKEYGEWTLKWMEKARKVLAENGSLYVVSGHTNLRHILNAADVLGLNLINHLIWKFNFGVYTKKKFVTSHYHILYYSKHPSAKVVFNAYCRFGSQEKDGAGKSLLYQDLEDVFVINRDYRPNQPKNQNKLPEDLIRKILLYSSNEGDLVSDFFMGNFTTAYAALSLGRRVCGFELNKSAYDYHLPRLREIKFGSELRALRLVENQTPENQGQKVTREMAMSICSDYIEMTRVRRMKKKDASLELQKKYGRGRFSIKNILDRYLSEHEGQLQA